jgi:hypothetical protein
MRKRRAAIGGRNMGAGCAPELVGKCSIFSTRTEPGRRRFRSGCGLAALGHGDGRSGSSNSSFSPLLFRGLAIRRDAAASEISASSATKKTFGKNTIDLQWKIDANYNARPCDRKRNAASARTMGSNGKNNGKQ